MLKTTIQFNSHEFEVEYTIDAEIYENTVSIDSIKLNGIDFYWNFNDETICNIELLVLKELS